MAIATSIITRMTEEAFLRLPDDGRKYELVDGELKEVPASVPHDVIGSNVIFALKPLARGRGYITTGQAGFRMKSGNVRCPDVSYTRKERFPNGLPMEGFATQAPDWCIEIISPSEERADMERKVQEYFQSGAVLVWQMYPETQSINVFLSPTDTQTYTAEQVIDAGALLPGFHCQVGELFALE